MLSLAESGRPSLPHMPTRLPTPEDFVNSSSSAASSMARREGCLSSPSCTSQECLLCSHAKRFVNGSLAVLQMRTITGTFNRVDDMSLCIFQGKLRHHASQVDDSHGWPKHPSRP